MREYTIGIPDRDKVIRRGSLKLGGSRPYGESIGFTNYYIERNGRPFFGICGEFHYSRYPKQGWEDELVKMKEAGVNIISSYIFWNHHEEEEGKYDWEGDKDLRHFTEICAKHDLYVILRIGPFAHGEVRNGGFPDWLYGLPLTVRTNDEFYLFHAKRLYDEIGKQVRGLMYGEGGPVIGIQLENEHMHASPPWECTHSKVMEWVGNGSGGADHIKALKKLAEDAGMEAPIYTCTGWGGASFIEKETLPLYGGYSFEPWRKAYMGENEHRMTDEYLMKDFHDGKVPYACCELGGGMACWYEYRFQVPPESIVASTLVRIAGGCNFIGYYMFHDGSNPVGAKSYLNERNVPLIAYNFQAPVGEFGQLRESYRQLKPVLYFLKDFEDILCPMGTALPDNAAEITPEDNSTLRYAVRYRNGSGFIFLVNYQDHSTISDLNGIRIKLELNKEKIVMGGPFTLKKGVSAILPFNLDMDGVKLKYATAQLVTSIEDEGVKTYFFFVPEGMKGSYCFAAQGITLTGISGAACLGDNQNLVIDVEPGKDRLIELSKETGGKIRICTLTREESLCLWKCRLWGKDRIVLTDSEMLVKEDVLELRNTGNPDFRFDLFPAVGTSLNIGPTACESLNVLQEGIFTSYAAELPERKISVDVIIHGKADVEVRFPSNMFSGDNSGPCGEDEVFLRVDYTGDIGNAFIDGKLVEDDFFNGSTWEIGLARFLPDVVSKGMYFHIVPLTKESGVVFEKDISFRHGIPVDTTAGIHSIEAVPRYELKLKCYSRMEVAKDV